MSEMNSRELCLMCNIHFWKPMACECIESNRVHAIVQVVGHSILHASHLVLHLSVLDLAAACTSTSLYTEDS